MTAFFVAGMGDVATTAFGLAGGFLERGVAGRYLVEAGSPVNAMILRTAVTAVLIGTYALSQEKDWRYKFSFDRAIRISNIITWGVLAFNTIQFAPGMR